MSKQIFRTSPSVKMPNTDTYGTLRQAFNTIAKSEKMKQKMEIIRSEPDHKKRQAIKGDILPTIEFNSQCKGSRKIENVEKLTGYMIMDIDDLDADEARELSDEMFSEGWGTLVFISPSGLGVKALFKIPELTRENFERTWNLLRIAIHEKFGHWADKQTKDIVRLTYLSYDPNAHYDESESAFPYTIADLENEYGYLLEREMGKSTEKNVTITKRTALNSVGVERTKDVLREFADKCVQLNYSPFCEDSYYTWMGFGAQLHELFDGSQDGLYVWKGTSIASSKYDEGTINYKWNGKLPKSSGDGAIGTLINALKMDSYTNKVAEYLLKFLRTTSANKVDTRYTLLNLTVGDGQK